MKSAKNVDAYMAAAPAEARQKLSEVRSTIREAAPDAVESISYGMPFYSFRGEAGFQGRLCYFGALKGRIVMYMRPTVLEGRSDEVAEYRTAKSALQFSLAKPIPLPLIRKLVEDGVRKHVARQGALQARHETPKGTPKRAQASPGAPGTSRPFGRRQGIRRS
jgi:uncharacterized protein YdhG (YjbR/CyaY superfamily)